MIDRDTLAAYLEDALDAEALTQIEAQLASDPEALRYVVEQRKLDRLLRSALQPATKKQRVKQSIIAAVSGIAPEQLKARVLEETLFPQAAQRESGTTRPIVLSPIRRFIQSWLERFSASAFQRFALGAAAAVVLGVGLFFYFTTAQGPRVEVGQFAATTGAPKVQHSGQRSSLNAQPSTVIFLGDRIVTGDADKAELRFNDGTTLRLNFNTTLEIPNPKSEIRNPKSRIATLQRPPEVNLLRGQIWSKVQKTTNAPKFAVHTPVATAVVKGTEFGVKLQKANPAKLGTQNSQLATNLVAVLTVKEGRVEFSNSFGKVDAADLMESIATGDAAPTAPARVPSLKAFYVGTQYAVVVMTSRPSLPEAGERLMYRCGWTGLAVANVIAGQSAQDASTSARPIQILVVRVQKNSPAEKAGLRVRDVITALNGQPITNAWEVSAAIIKQVGVPITLTLASDQGPRVVTLITLAAPDAPSLPQLSRSAAKALEAASRLLLERRDDEAERSFAQLLGTEAGAAAHNNLGLLYETKDALAQALAHYQQAVMVAPQVALFHFNYGMALQNLGNLERAAEELELATRLAPSWPDAFDVLADVYGSLDRHADALRAVESALSLNLQSPDLWVSKGTVLARHDRHEEARQAFSKALELEPTFAAAFRELGDLCHHEGKFEEAEKLLRQAIELDPSDADAFNALGNVHIDQQRFTEAEQALREAIRLNPAHAISYSNLGYLYRRRGQTAEAEKMYQKAIELDPESPIGYTNLGELYRRLGRLDEAERMLRAGIELDPQNATAINNLGGLYYYNRRQFDQAEKVFRRAMEVDPSLPFPYNNLGNLLLDRGSLDEAEPMYRKAIELFGERPEAAQTWVNLAKLQEKRGDSAAAVEAYRKALRLKPDFAEAADALKRLGQ